MEIYWLGAQPQTMRRWRGSDEEISVFEVRFNTGYERHLKGVYALLLKKINNASNVQQALSSELASAQRKTHFFAI